MNADLLQGFYLGEFLVEPLKGQVTGRTGGRHLPPKAVEVLLCLAHSPGELVERETLLDTAWGAGQGSSEALGHAISEIRHALGDHPENPVFIQTMPRRGYRLVVAPKLAADATTVTPPAAELPKWWQALLRHGVVQAGIAYLVTGWLLIQVADTTFDKIGLPPWAEHFVTFTVIGGFPLLVLLAWFLEFVGGRVEHDRGQQSGGLFQGLARNYLAIFIAYGVAGSGAGVYQATVGFPVPMQDPITAATPVEEDLIPIADNSLAMLKLATFDGDPVTRAFSDGLSEDILDGLARVPGLFVSARGDSWSLPPNAPSELVRRRLRVANYIEGSVRFLGDRLRVVVQLIDSVSGFHLFSRSFEVDIGDTVAMQREVTTLVVANLKLAVDDAAFESSVYASDAPDDDAYLAYLLGREALQRPLTVANLEEAVEQFRRALGIDDDYPAAHAGLCNAYTTLYQHEEDTADIALAEEACARALAVAPRLPVVLNAVARLYFRTGRHEEAASMYLDALAINDQDAVAMKGLAEIRRREQRFDEAERLLRRAIELQPGNWSSINSLGNMYFGMGEYAAAATEYRKLVFLDPDNFVALGNLGSTSLMSGDFARARDALQRTIEIEENAILVTNLGIAYYYLGDFETAVATLGRGVELAPQSATNWLALADALRFAGDDDASREAYARARELAREQVNINAQDVDSLNNLAWATAMTGDLHEALRIVAHAVELDPAYPYSHYYDALIKHRAEQADAALDAAREALVGGYPVAMLAAEPILKGMQDDARFVALLAQHNSGGQEQ